jgi:AbrB family looped-hinge helix DNA binding protein
MMTDGQKPFKVTRKGQVTLPKEFRDTLGVEEGDVLYVAVEDGNFVFSKPGLPEPGHPVGKRDYEELVRALKEARKAWR